MNRSDIVIVGAGIAGASLAAEIAPHSSVIVIEEEDAPGYHATGRSAAFWSETYGGPAIQPLTTASGPALQAGGFLDPLGSLHIGRATDGAAIETFLREFEQSKVELIAIDPATLVSGLRSDWTFGVFEPSCAYIDVAALHADCLARAKAAGARVITRAGLQSASRTSGGWMVETVAGPIKARLLVNAAGAWADTVAQRVNARPLDIHPYRRTLVQLRTDPPVDQHMPHVADIMGGFYFKPEAGGKLWLSPADETPADAGDAAPEEIDVAIAIDRLEQAVDWRIEAVERKWAGLRSFAPDRRPVYGFDPHVAGFFWCAGQGGFGIQTAPAAAKLAAALLLGAPADASVAHIDPGLYAPARFAL